MLIFWVCFALMSMLVASAAEMEGQKQTGERKSALENKPEPLFDIQEFVVLGNSLLSTKQVERVVYPHLGKNKTIKDIEKVRLDLEQLYRAEGYPTVLVDIPEQKVRRGLVRLKVTEAKIDHLRISGSRYFLISRVRESVPSLQEGRVLYTPQVQKELARLNRFSGDRRVTPILKPGLIPGTTQVNLQVKDELPLHGQLEMNNRHSPGTTEQRLLASLHYDNLWQRAHSLTLNYQTAPEKTDEVQVFSLSYLWKFQRSDKMLALYAVSSDSETTTLGEQSVIGKGDIFGTRFIWPVPGSVRYFHSFSLGADYKKFDESVGTAGADRQTTPIDYVNFSIQYSGTYQWSAGSAHMGAGPNFAIRGIDEDVVKNCLNGEENEFNCKRAEAKPNYFYLLADVGVQSRFVLGSVLSLQLSAQLSDMALISNEQFSAGGQDTVRGYYESQELGDSGLTANFEWLTPSMGSLLSSRINQLSLLLFADYGVLKVQETVFSPAQVQELASTGAGLRLQLFKSLALRTDWAYLLNSAGSSAEGDSRLHVQMTYSF